MVCHTYITLVSSAANATIVLMLSHAASRHCFVCIAGSSSVFGIQVMCCYYKYS